MIFRHAAIVRSSDFLLLYWSQSVLKPTYYVQQCFFTYISLGLKCSEQWRSRHLYTTNKITFLLQWFNEHNKKNDENTSILRDVKKVDLYQNTTYLIWMHFKVEMKLPFRLKLFCKQDNSHLLLKSKGESVNILYCMFYYHSSAQKERTIVSISIRRWCFSSPRSSISNCCHASSDYREKL